MYKFKRENQISFTDFNQPLGLQMNPDSRLQEEGIKLISFDIDDTIVALEGQCVGEPGSAFFKKAWY